MATFFNRKEEVIDLQLTRHGRYLLSIGKFKPEFYEFYDDDVVYDSEYAGIVEIQNKAVERIKETPRIKQQTTYNGVETEVRTLNEHIRSFNDQSGEPVVDFYGLAPSNKKWSQKNQQFSERNSALMFPIGNSEMNKRFKPSFEMRFLKAPILTSEPNFTGSSEQTLYIPQLNIEHTINTYVQSDGPALFDTDDLEANPDNTADGEVKITNYEIEGKNSQLISNIYSDGSYIISNQDYLFLDALEKNAGFSKENFDIEVFMIDEKENGQEDITPLSFYNHSEIDPTTPGDIIDFNFPQLNPTYVEYWFDVDTDNEISQEIFCELRHKHYKKNLFADLHIDIDCEEEEIEKTYTRPPIEPEEEIC